MIDKFKVLDIVKDVLEGSDKYLVNMKITPDNRIFVDIDGDNGINIDDCIEVSRAIENGLNRDEEDFELNVSSAGADAPLKMPRQYRRHVGRELSVEPFDGEKVEGRLTEAGDTQFTIKTKGTKKEAPQELTFAYDDVKTARVIIQF
ncbi:MAG: ribosome assembly cofactor RimP [Bacteroidales bacterium]|nr:ribosome assembly cofactor RimP [Bacteroidales bacterium]